MDESGADKVAAGPLRLHPSRPRDPTGLDLGLARGVLEASAAMEAEDAAGGGGDGGRYFKADLTGAGVVQLSERVREKLREFVDDYTNNTLVVRRRRHRSLPFPPLAHRWRSARCAGSVVTPFVCGLDYMLATSGF